MITVLALLVLFALHGAVIAASARRHRPVLAPPSIPATTVPVPLPGRAVMAPPATRFGDGGCPPPVDLAAYRLRRQAMLADSRAVARDGDTRRAALRLAVGAVREAGEP